MQPKALGHMRLSTKVTIGAAAIIILVNVGVLHLVGYRYESERRSELTESARSFYKLVVVMRSWVSSHDGVYVRKQPGVEPNPYLGNPMVVTVEGDTLVWRNPAMVT